MNDNTGRQAYLDEQLDALSRAYALKAAIAAGDPNRLELLREHYFRDSMVLLTTASGRECADLVRLSHTRPSPGSRPRARPWLRRAGESIVRNAQEWHNQVLGMAGPR